VDASAVLVEARRRSGLTLRQLARRAGTSHSAIAAYESGAKSPNTATWQRLVRGCGFEIETELRPVASFEDRPRRGRELLEVLDLADQFPSEHGASITKHFPRSRRSRQA
jgi:transcriptional regulator with XRE-family HTH domain